MLILEKIHKNVYAAGSMTTSSLSFKQKTMPKRPFMLNIPLHLEIQFSLWNCCYTNQVKELHRIPVGKLRIALKALGEVIDKHRCWQSYKYKSFRAEDNL